MSDEAKRVNDDLPSSSQSYVCIHCMTPADSLYKTYPSFIRMTQCKECDNDVDKYVEYDSVLVVIDLLLQYSEAYRHILYNRGIQHFSRLLTIFLFCGAYERWIEARQNQEKVFDLEWRFYLCLLESTVEIGIYVLSALVLEFFLKGSLKRAAFVSKAVVAGFYGRVCVVLSIIFHLYSEPSYRILTQLFLLISHFQICRALHPQLSLMRAVVFVCLSTLFAQILPPIMMASPN
ncbi:unnamed protein product, partial [Mesorhabditis belari]|uniref:Protein ARV n=1 Tax=Mesorhabditis belari TaxID=2138241 RepID=A0AAF3F0D5_9BILA